MPTRAAGDPSSRLRPSASAGPYVTAPHSQRHVRCRPQEHAMPPTKNRPGRNRWPSGQRIGGRAQQRPPPGLTRISREIAEGGGV
jgi:hypothetical protein